MGRILSTLGVLAALVNPAAAEPVRVVALGDSLTAGYNLPRDAAFPVRLEAALRKDGLDVRVENAGVSGDTTAGGLARLDWALGGKPQAVVVELGANDALRGVDPRQTEANLDTLLARLKARGIKVLLAGMKAPPNWGPEYRQAFDGLYSRLAERHGVLLYPFFLEGVAAVPGLNQDDGIHPTAAGVDEIVRRILPFVKSLLSR
ncbi:MAG: arylesterase [Magnetospirillum sp. WYHS-4]